MSTDLEQLVKNLTEFYDFRDKIVIAVGAGGGQLIEYARHAQRVIAIDQDAAADLAVENAWAAVTSASIVRQRDVDALQRFDNFGELEARFAQQPTIYHQRLAPLRGRQPIAIPMPYRIALLEAAPDLPTSRDDN